MSCTVCQTDSKCPHNERSTLYALFTKKKAKKLPEDNSDAIVPCESSSGGASSDRPPGFMKYLKRCFRLHFRGNSSKKHKPKTIVDSELVETVSPDPEIDTLYSPVNTCDPATVSNIPANSEASSQPVTSPSEAPCSSNPIALQLVQPDPEDQGPDHSETENTINNTQKSLAVELLNLSKYGWYWGPITQAEAVEKLLDQPDGSFLVRDSYADHFLVSMSFKTLGKIYHTRINHNNGRFFFYSSPVNTYASIPELIGVSMDSSKSSIFCYSRPSSPFSPSLPIRLTRPISRFTQVRSLQHLCRFVIRQYTRIDQIKQLPLPNKLCGYLEAKQF